MLSTSFDPHIINYDLPKGFVVPKFTMYDGLSNLFDHLMHFQQIMTLDIGTTNTQCLKMMFEQPPKKSSSQTRRRKIVAPNRLITRLSKVAKGLPFKGNRDGVALIYHIDRFICFVTYPKTTRVQMARAH